MLAVRYISQFLLIHCCLMTTSSVWAFLSQSSVRRSFSFMAKISPCQVKSTGTTSLFHTGKNIVCPATSPATGLANRFYIWKNGQSIRYQSTTSTKKSSTTAPILLIHGLFTNSDHWRRTLNFFQSSDDYTAYALDLYGCGYSDMPLADSIAAQACNGESSRFNDNDSTDGILRNVTLGSADGSIRSGPVDIELRHPLGSPYNFYTWADLIADFCKDVILSTHTTTSKQNISPSVTLVCNSIGTISSLQAVLDHSTLFNGVFVVSPNFRELHSAEVPLPLLTMPILRFQQNLLRNYIGQAIFDQLAKPEIVRDILYVPYAVKDAVDDELVKVLLDPLLTPGASNVVFDTLSYSAGPLPEPQLEQLVTSTSTATIPVWVCYGSDDPWTPARRVEALQRFRPVVQKVVCFPSVGHCPHDEAPELVHPLLMEFLKHCATNNVPAR
jgi:pimeloyl-ACP methyl ester carboxylesterase